MSIAEDKIKELAFKFGKELAKSAAKHFAAEMGGNSSGFTETVGRGGAGANGTSPSNGMQDHGGIQSAKRFNKDVEELSDSLDSATNIISSTFKHLGMFGTSVKSLFSETGRDALGKAKMEHVLEGTQDIVDMQTGMYKELAKVTLSYVKDAGTNIDMMDKVSDALDDYRTNLHKYSRDGDVDAIQGDKLRRTRIDLEKDLHKRFGITIDILGELGSEGAKYAKQVEAGAMSRSRLNKKDKEAVGVYEKQMQSVRDLSGVLNTAGNTIAEVGISATDSLMQMTAQHKANMLRALQIASASAGAGFYQLYNDAITKYQTQINRSWSDIGWTSAMMGMSVNETLQGILEFRDTLRQQAILYGGTTHDVDLGAIEELGGRFGMIGDAAFDFGMKMHDSARKLGMGKNLDTTDMGDFYRDSSKALNMTVEEFGNQFHALSNDPNFVGFVNNIRTIGVDVQDSVMKEMKNRIRMNKILGLSNEHMQQRLNMEQQSKWQGIAERTKATIGASQLMNMLNEQLGLGFTQDDSAAFAQYKRDPSMLTSDQWDELNNRILPAMTLAPALGAAQYTKVINDPNSTAAEKARARADKDMYATQLNIWGDLMGGIDKDAAELAYSHIKGYIDPLEATRALIKSTDLLDPEMKKFVETMQGLTEPDIDRNWFMAIIQEAQKKVQGLALSGPAKAGFGVVGALGSVAWEASKMKMMANMVKGGSTGLMSGVALAGPKMFIDATKAATTGLWSFSKMLLLIGGGLPAAITSGVLLGLAGGNWIQNNQDTNGMAGALKWLSDWTPFGMTTRALSWAMEPDGNYSPDSKDIEKYSRGRITDILSVGQTDAQKRLNSYHVANLSSGEVKRSMAYLRLDEHARRKEEEAIMSENSPNERTQLQILESMDAHIKTTADKTTALDKKKEKEMADAVTGQNTWLAEMAKSQASAVGFGELHDTSVVNAQASANMA